MQGKLLLFLSLLMITFHFTWIVLFVLPSSYVQYHGYIYFLPQSYTQEYSYLCKQHGFCCDKLNVALISFKGNRRPHTPHAGFVRFLFLLFGKLKRRSMRFRSNRVCLFFVLLSIWTFFFFGSCMITAVESNFSCCFCASLRHFDIPD